MGDSIVRKTDFTLNKVEDIVVCLPGARIEHVIESPADHGTWKWRFHTGSHRDEQCRQGRNSGEVVGTRSQGYRNSRRMVINRLVKQLCEEDEV